MKYTVAYYKHPRSGSVQQELCMTGYIEAGSPLSAIHAVVSDDLLPGHDYEGWVFSDEDGVGTFEHPVNKQRLVAISRPDHHGSHWVADQKLTFQREISKRQHLTVTIRFDDQCGNGYNSFSITGEHRVCGKVESCGCLHEMIAEVFPDLAGFIKWHLCAADGPMHYLANTLYLAGDKDCNGGHKGEHKTNSDGEPLWQFEGPDWDTLRWGEKPTDCGQWVPVLYTGKEHDFDAARQAAIWPDACDEELEAVNLPNLLKQRLPKLIRDFRTDIQTLGLRW